jgi:hypothetical protein
MVVGKPRQRLSPLVAGYTGYRIDGARPGVHRGLPSRYLTFIVTLDGTVDLATMPDPAQPPASFTTLVGGLHATPALISHNGQVAGRVMRFEVAHRLLRAPHGPGLAEVAAHADFYDQSHLHREWRELAGCTPSRWLAEEFPFVHDGEPRGGTSSMA